MSATAVDPEDADGGGGERSQGPGGDSGRGSDDEDTSMRRFMRSLKQSLRGISTKQDAQHEMITDLRDKLEAEAATRTSEIQRLEECMVRMSVKED